MDQALKDQILWKSLLTMEMRSLRAGSIRTPNKTGLRLKETGQGK